MSLSILIAPSGFKESLDVTTVAKAIAKGISKVNPTAKILMAPMVDGGEGFTEGIINATKGSIYNKMVTGPVGEPVDAFFGMMGGEDSETAVIEMAAAAGLRLVPRDQRDPTTTTSYGVGELMLAALDQGAKRILIGCGDSGINDGGVGMAQALGVRFLDRQGRELPFGGGALIALDRIDMSGIDPRVHQTRIDVAVNWHNVLLGPKGVARVFGPQKGATPDQVEMLEQGLENLAACMKRDLAIDIGMANGSGASGGLGAGLAGFAGAHLHPRFNIVMQYLDFDRLLESADMVFTAEGSLDFQSPFGKVPCEVARRAKARNLPVIALAGTIGKGAADTFQHGIDAFASIIKRPCSLENAIAEGEELLCHAAEDAMRMVMVGEKLALLRKAA
jgi:glycerate 2-kinase